MDNQYSKIEEIYKKTRNIELIKKYISSLELNMMALALIFYIILIIYLVVESINYAILSEFLLLIGAYLYKSKIPARINKEFEKDEDLKGLITDKLKYVFYEKYQIEYVQFVYFKYLLIKNNIGIETLEEYKHVLELKYNLSSSNYRGYDFFNTIISGIVIGGCYFLISITYPFLVEQKISYLSIFLLIGLSILILIMFIYVIYEVYISSKEKKYDEGKKMNAYIDFLIKTKENN